MRDQLLKAVGDSDDGTEKPDCLGMGAESDKYYDSRLSLCDSELCLDEIRFEAGISMVEMISFERPQLLQQKTAGVHYELPQPSPQS